MNTPIEQKILRTNGISMNVVQAGPKDGKPLFLLHGFPEFWYGWRNQIDHLAELGFRLWIPDQRGYNLTDKPKGLSAYRVDELVRDIVGLIDLAGEQKVFVAGHDWGAMVTWWLALRHPERIERMAILNVPHPRVFQRHLKNDFKQMLKSWYAMYFQLPILPEMAVRFNSGKMFAQAIKLSGLKSTFSAEDMARYREAWTQKGAAQGMLNWYRAYGRHLPEAPKSWRIKPKTLIIWGEKDIALSKDMVEPSADLCDDVQVEMLNKASHWVQHDEKERVNQLFGAFFKLS